MPSYLILAVLIGTSLTLALFQFSNQSCIILTLLDMLGQLSNFSQMQPHTQNRDKRKGRKKPSPFLKCELPLFSELKMMLHIPFGRLLKTTCMYRSGYPWPCRMEVTPFRKKKHLSLMLKCGRCKSDNFFFTSDLL